MKIDISQELMNSDGKVAIEAESKEPFTLKHALIQILLANAGENSDKIKKYGMYRDVVKSRVGFVSWTAEEVALVKKTVLETHATLVAGQVHEMMEREYQPPAPEVEPVHERMAHEL